MQTFDTYADLKSALEQLGPDDVLAGIVLTPALAHDILQHDPINRKIRSANLLRIKRDIEGDFWVPAKSSPIQFLNNTYQLANGQHRCRAVVETGKSIITSMTLVTDTVGVDEGAARTLADHLRLRFGYDDTTAQLTATVIKTLYRVQGAGNREFLAFYEDQGNQLFVNDCVVKPQEWLAGMKDYYVKVFPVSLMATLRARLVRELGEDVEAVDQLFVDAINEGTTAPDGSVRQNLALQLYKAMAANYEAQRSKTKRTHVLHWLLLALKYERAGVSKNILAAKIAKAKKATTSKR